MYSESQFIADYNSLLPGYSLTGDQELALRTVSGPVLVSAGPGSGKTETLVARTLRLIVVDGVLPSSIVLTTFTRKAARQMLDRISQRLTELKLKFPKVHEIQSAELLGIRLGTIHSLAEEFLSGIRSPNFIGKTVIDEIQLQMLMLNTGNRNTVYCTNAHPLKQFNETSFGKPLFGEGWVRRLNLLFNHLTEDRIDVAAFSGDPGRDALLVAYEHYKTTMANARRLDFALLLDLLWHEINTGGLDELIDTIEYVMVDEYQDTNPIQEDIFFGLAQNSNLCVVGDDDQSLYRFRGASVECMVAFDPECKGRFGAHPTKINLLDNYRSHPVIVEFYESYMNSHTSINTGTFRLRPGGTPALVAKGKMLASNPAVWFAQGRDAKEADDKLVEFISGLKSANIIEDWSQVAILSPSVNESTKNGVGYLVNELETLGIPVYNPRGKDMSETEEVMALYGLISLVIDTTDVWKVALAGDYNKETYQWVSSCRQIAQTLKATHSDVAQYITEAHTAISSASDDTSYSLMKIVFHILNLTPFVDWAKDISSSWRLAQASNWIEGYTMTPSSKSNNPAYQNIFVSSGSISLYQVNGFYRLASQGIAEGRTVEHEEEDEVVIQGNISVMTIHQSKGLEFDVVIVRGLRVRNSAHHRLPAVMHQYFAPWRIRPISAGPDVNTLRDFDSFRSYYVAFSRAKHALVLHDPNTWKGVPNERGYHEQDRSTTHGIVTPHPLMEVLP
jgi:DNA helicase-2/ATP-dependent DNA helicase PcrA